MSGVERGDETPAERAGSLPARRVTINQLIGYNVTFLRRAAGLTQDALGKRLGWSGSSVSAAERSWEGVRVRKFDADEIVKIAAALGVPVLALLLPPPDAGTAVDYSFDFGAGAAVGVAELLANVAPSYGRETPALAAFRERLIALGASNSRYGYDPVADAVVEEILLRARWEADNMLIKARGASEEVTWTARQRAEALELEARERHRQALGSLGETREQLEKRVDDLRAFEREYRSRLLAYLESQIRDLKAGGDAAFPAPGPSDDDLGAPGGGQA